MAQLGSRLSVDGAHGRLAKHAFFHACSAGRLTIRGSKPHRCGARRRRKHIAALSIRDLATSYALHADRRFLPRDRHDERFRQDLVADAGRTGRFDYDHHDLHLQDRVRLVRHGPDDCHRLDLCMHRASGEFASAHPSIPDIAGAAMTYGRKAFFKKFALSIGCAAIAFVYLFPYIWMVMTGFQIGGRHSVYPLHFRPDPRRIPQRPRRRCVPRQHAEQHPRRRHHDGRGAHSRGAGRLCSCSSADPGRALSARHTGRAHGAGNRYPDPYLSRGVATRRPRHAWRADRALLNLQPPVRDLAPARLFSRRAGRNPRGGDHRRLFGSPGVYEDHGAPKHKRHRRHRCLRIHRRMERIPLRARADEYLCYDGATRDGELP